MLTAVKGSPFSDGESSDQRFGVGLAAGGSLLFAGNTDNNSISVLRINSKCSLKLLTKVAVPGSPAGMKVTPDNKSLIVAYIGQVDSFGINFATGHLDVYKRQPHSQGSSSCEGRYSMRANHRTLLPIRLAAVLFLVSALSPTGWSAAKYKILHDFGSKGDGAIPYGPLVLHGNKL